MVYRREKEKNLEKVRNFYFSVIVDTMKIIWTWENFITVFQILQKLRKEKYRIYDKCEVQ